MQLKNSGKYFWPGLLLVYSLLTFVVADIARNEITCIRAKNSSEELQKKLSKSLSEAILQAEPGYSINQLLCSILHQGGDSPAEIRKLQTQRLEWVRRAFPGKLRFFLQNPDGTIDQQLSDKVDSRFFLQKSFNLFSRVVLWAADSKGNRETPPAELDNELKRLRPFLGNLLTLRTAYDALSPVGSNRLMLANTSIDSNYLWFDEAAGQTMFVFIHADVVARPWGLINLCRAATTDNFIRVGCGRNPANVFAYGEAGGDLCNELQAALFELKSSGGTYIEKKNICLMARNSANGLLVFAWAPAAGNLVDVLVERRNFREFLFILELLIILAIVLPGLATGGGFVSLRLEIALLFLLASLLPAIIIGFQGMAYLEYSRGAHVLALQQQMEKSLASYDSDFRKLPETLKTRLQQLQNKFASLPEQDIDENKVSQQMYDGIAELQPDILYLVASDGQIIRDMGAKNTDSQRVSDLYGRLGSGMLATLNGTAGRVEPPETLTDRFAEISTGRTVAFLRLTGLTPMLLFGRKVVFSYSIPFSGHSAPVNHIILCGWSYDRLFELYLQTTFATFKDENRQFQCFATVNPGAHRSDLPFMSLPAMKATRWSALQWSDSFWAGIGMLGRKTANIGYIMLYPRQQVDKIFSDTAMLLSLFVIGYLIISLLLAAGFAREILEPVKDLSLAVAAIRVRNFSFRISSLPANEFGELGATFNSTIAGLKELEIAANVQQSLYTPFPAEFCDFALQAFMPEEGFYGQNFAEAFRLSPYCGCVLLASFRDGGIQAGLQIAMLKALIINCKRNEKTADDLLADIQSIFGKLSADASDSCRVLLFTIVEADRQVIIYNYGYSAPLLIYDDQTSRLTPDAEGRAVVALCLGQQFVLAADKPDIFDDQISLNRLALFKRVIDSEKTGDTARIAASGDNEQPGFMIYLAYKGEQS